MSRTIKRLSIILLAGFLFGATARAATYTAASCSYADVNAVINGPTHTAVDGDVIVIPDLPNVATCASTTPGGVNTWTSSLNITKAITLQGQGIGNTVIIDNVDKTGCSDHPVLNFYDSISDNNPVQITGFTIQGDAADSGQCSEFIKIMTGSHALRIDHISFTNMTTTGILVDGDEWGVVDHCSFYGTYKRGVLIRHSNWQNVGSWGDNSWAQPDTMGTVQAMYVEDCDFEIVNASGVGNVACEVGGRCVARHNTKLEFVGTHGVDTGLRCRSIRHFEVYNNLVNDNGSQVGQFCQLRGGTAMVFNNTLTRVLAGSYVGNSFQTQVYREADGWAPWGPAGVPNNRGGCDGTGPFDNNDGVTYDSGTAAAASTTDTLSDASKSWTTNQFVGYSLRNKTVPWGASIQSNTATTITTYPQTQSTGAHTWKAGNSYQILKVYPCLDQIGVGAGTYVSGGGNAAAPGPAGWPKEAPDPVYAWNNTLSGSLISMLGKYYTHIQADRDYYEWAASFNGTSGVGQGLLSARPSTCTPQVAYWATDANSGAGELYQCTAKNTWTAHYTPYTYPHPLTLGSGTALNAPTSVTVVSVQ